MRSSRASFQYKKTILNVIECQERGVGFLTLRAVVSLGQTLRYAGKET